MERSAGKRAVRYGVGEIYGFDFTNLSADKIRSLSSADCKKTPCPQRFLESNLVFEWVGETLLGTKNPLIVSELPFLMSQDESSEDSDAVGMIDKVLVNASGPRLIWCALEMQAVYFSGRSMENEFKLMRKWHGPGLPFPQAHRRPDFRSSGPKSGNLSGR